MAETHTRSYTIAIVFVFCFVIVVGGAVLGGTMLWIRTSDRYKGYSAPELFVEIPPGAGAVDIRRALVDAGVVRDDLAFRVALWWTGHARDLQAGEYRFAEPLSAMDVVEKIARGEVYGRRVTFPEGLTLEEMADIYEMRGFGRRADFLAATARVEAIAPLDPEARDLEGYLFPETYAVPRNVPADRLVSMMVERFLAVFTPDLRQRAATQGLTVRQVVTLASLVEKETARADERPLVAAVYRNRMAIGMGMQADPTVVYALRKAGRYDGNIRRDDLQIDSPYNTYRYSGLPPGPIAAPGQAALEAVLAPADVRHLYFVSRNDGSHVFADTLAAHNANVREYQIRYFQRQRAAERAAGSR